MAVIDKKAVFAELERRRAERAKLEKTIKAKGTVQNETRKAVPNKVDRKTVVSETRRYSGEPRSINEAIAVRTKSMAGETKHMYEMLAENIAKATQTIYGEATQANAGAGAVSAGAGVGLVKTYFDIFFGYFPSLIVPELASTQPIKTQKAMVFYYETVAGSNKGGVQQGQKLITPFEVNTNPEYTSDEVTIAINTAVPLWGPFVSGSIKLVTTAGVEVPVVWSAADAAFASVDPDVVGTVTLTDTTITVGLKTSLDAAITSGYKVVYRYDNIYAPTEVPELNANIDSREITAKARTIKTNYSFQAGFGFEAQFGVKLEDKLAESAMYELKRETDLDFVFEIMKSAPAKITWNRAAGVPNGLYEFHKLSFVDAVAAASNYIFQKSKRASGNVLLVGINAQTIVQTLPSFKGETYGSQLGGAKVIGKLGDNMKVIAIPELGNNDWAVIYKNPKDNLDAGIIFAPYIPVVATPTVMLDDFMARKAYTTSYGKLVVNAAYFVRGEIIDNPVAAPVFLVTKDGTAVYGAEGTDAILGSVPVVTP